MINRHANGMYQTLKEKYHWEYVNNYEYPQLMIVSSVTN